MARILLKCKCGKQIAIDPLNRSVEHQQYISGLLQKFNVVTTRELVAVYKCRAHRKTPFVEQQTVIPSANSDAVQKMQVFGEGKNIELDNYSNFYVGFEFEGFTRDSYGITADIARKFGVTNQKTQGMQTVRQRIPILEGQSIEVPVRKDLYKEANVVTQVYPDGSVGPEVVTRPVHISNLKIVKQQVFDYLTSRTDIEMKHQKAGLHMTVLLDTHKEHSKYDIEVVKNIIQMVRYNYKTLIQMFSQSKRGTAYRIMPSFEYARSPINHAQHRFAVSVRYEGNTVWGLEFRLPDGTNNWDMVVEQARFYCAMIRHCAKLTKLGTIYIPQERFNSQNNFYRSNSASLETSRTTQEEQKEAQDLMNRLKDEISFIKKEDNTSVENLYEKVAETARTATGGN